jgi:hypothetical protein
MKRILLVYLKIRLIAFKNIHNIGKSHSMLEKGSTSLKITLQVGATPTVWQINLASI